MYSAIVSDMELPEGPALARMMKKGTRVVRGKDWKWGNQVRFTVMKTS